MKNRFISLLLICCLLVGLLPISASAVGNVSPFIDVASDAWYASSVQYVYDNGLMVGTSDTRFGPGTTTTRGMIVTIIHRMEDTPASSGSTFSDVPADKWFSNAVTWASANNIFSGYGNGRFGPNDTITREQMATIMYRYASFKGYKVTDTGNLAQFRDSGRISDWARTALSWANGVGLINGKGNGILDPKGSATRAEVASILKRFSDKVIVVETNPISTEDAQKMSDLVDEIENLTSLGASSEEVEDYLSQKQFVEEIYHYPDGSISCKTSFGINGVWSPNNDNYISANSGLDSESTTSSQTVFSASGQNADGLNIVILVPYASTDSSFDVSRYNSMCQNIVDVYGGSITIIKDNGVSLEQLKHLDSYDIVFFYSHGTLSYIGNSAWSILESDPYTMTGEFAGSSADYILWSNDFFFGRTVINLADGRIGVGGNFYKHYYSEHQLDGMMFHFGSCYSMRTDKLADGILSRGASWVQGWTNKVFFDTDCFQLLCFIGYMLEGNTAAQSVAEAPSLVSALFSSSYLQNDCDLKGKGEGSYRFGGYEPWKTHKYEVFSGVASTWDEASAYCQARGGHLATITSQGENDYVYQLIRDAGYTSAYFGLSDRAEEGTWVWVTGEPVYYTNWHSGEPNSENANEDYAMFYYKYSDGKWNDGTFGGRNPEFICEWDSEDAYSKYIKDFQTSSGDSYSKQANAMKDAYIAVLDSFPKTTEHTYTISGKKTSYYEDTRYGIYDIDKNKIPELIVQVDKSKFYVYTYQNNQAVLCTIDSMDNVRWSYDSPLYKYNGNGLLVHDGGSGNLHIEYISLYVLSGNKLNLSTNILDTAQGSNYQEIRDYLSKSTPLSPQMSSINVDDWQARIALQIVGADW